MDVVQLSVSNKIKALLQLKGQEQIKLAAHLKISKQALSNKFYRDSFSAADLIKIGQFVGCDLAYIVNDKQNIVFDINDLQDDEKEQPA